MPASPLGRRLVRLYTGLVLYGTGAALQVRAALGLDPWDVLHQGLARRLGVTIGTVSIVVGALVLILWWPLRQRPGVGTVSNVFLVGLSMDAVLRLVPAVHPLPARVVLLAAGIAVGGLATGLYISAGLGPGPRDGLMTGLHRRTGRSIRLVRTGIEAAVLAAGVALGGSAGIGTLAYALGIGPLSQLFLGLFGASGQPQQEPPASGAHAGASGARARARARAEAGADIGAAAGDHAAPAAAILPR